MKNNRFPSFGEWSVQKESEQGILVFRDKGGKFLETQHNLAILTHNCDIKIDSQVVDGEYRWLLIEVSPMGSLDRETFERDPTAPALYVKRDYKETHPNTIFSTTKSAFRVLCSYIDEGRNNTFFVQDGIHMREITEEEYNDPNYVF